MGKFRTIVLDPPWEYTRTGVSWHDRTSGAFTGTGLPYSTMPLEEIAALPIANLAADDCHLYLWTTQRYLEDSFQLVRGWGFTPSTVLTWCKPVRGWTVGGAFMSNTEFCLFARRGHLRALQRANSQWWAWPRGPHSQKPDAFMDIVETVSPDPRLEMFSRRARLGWETWGNESLGGGTAAELSTGADGPADRT